MDRAKKGGRPVHYARHQMHVRCEPRGVCLIISPWNYPFGLCIGPLVAALSAGNTAILKPSEMTPHVSGLITEMCRDVFPDGVVAAFEGGPECSQELLALPFDHIFFTGSPTVGKIVMKAAAENLASITLELGGKCPAIVTSSANINDAARRIAVSKFVNNGQTCVAPDYVLVQRPLAEPFLRKLTDETLVRFGEGKSIAESGSYCRMVNAKHYKRVLELLEDALERGGRAILTGEHHEQERFIHPTIITDVPHDAAINEEEIFGPVLPVIIFDSLEEAIQIVNGKPKPLSLYIFSSRTAEIEKVMRETSSGTCCV
ncbi:MAG: aldehyde dehydrogenase family protein, partial [Bacteroidia bacterium]|nr:aldehyde dehydrogenase family protein [Bacteroidia bacterium]